MRHTILTEEGTEIEILSDVLGHQQVAVTRKGDLLALFTWTMKEAKSNEEILIHVYAYLNKHYPERHKE